MDAQLDPAPPRRRVWVAPVVGIVLISAAAFALVIARHSASPVPGGTRMTKLGDNAPPVGRPAPEFSLPLFDGGTLSLRNLRGKPVLLNFWASWCVPCREEMPMLVRLHKIYGPRGVEFVGIDSEDQVASARQFIAEYHVDYALARLDDDRVIDAYAVPGLPTTVFIGADGIVSGKVVGGFVGPEGEKLLIAHLDRLLAGSHR